MTPRRRADMLLVERGLFESRAKAQAAIAAGLVMADGAGRARLRMRVPPMPSCARKPAIPACRAAASSSATRSTTSASPVAGRICLDVGASTGGFTEVLLARGAGASTPSMSGATSCTQACAAAPEVVVLERPTSAGSIRRGWPRRPSLVTIDVSFISLKLVLPAALALAQRPALLVALIKPQFEAAAPDIKKGIVRDAGGPAAVVRRDRRTSRAARLAVIGLIPSRSRAATATRVLIGAAA